MTSNQVLKVSVVRGKNRLRGNGEGFMFRDDFDTPLDALRKACIEEAKVQGFEPSPSWLRTVLSQLLKMYEGEFKKWEQSPNGTIGFVWETTLPSGQRILFGDQRVLDRLPFGSPNHDR